VVKVSTNKIKSIETQTQKNLPYCMISFLWYSGKEKIVGMEFRSIASRSWRGEERTDCDGAHRIFWMYFLIVVVVVI
jgi:hypothetical protein